LRDDNSAPTIARRQLSVGRDPRQMRADNSAQLKRVYEVYKCTKMEYNVA